MKDTVIKVVLTLAFVVLLSGQSLAQDFTIESQWMIDQSFQGTPNPNLLKNASPESIVPGFWWRDTANQNALAQHTFSEFTGAVTEVYTSPEIQVWVYSSRVGPNVVMLTTPTKYLLVGTGGGASEAIYAKAKFTAAVPGLAGKQLKGVVYPDAYPESWQGASRWTAGTGVNFFISYSLSDAVQRRLMVANALAWRESYICGWGLPFSPDGFIGMGSFFQHQSELAEPAPFMPSGMVYIVTQTTMNIEGVSVMLTPASQADGSLLVFLPSQKVLITPNMGTYLPDAGSIARPGISVNDWISRIQRMMNLAPTTYVPLNGKPIIGATEVQDALGAQRSALQLVLNETVSKINQLEPLDDIVTSVKLPAALADSPYTQEFAGKVEDLVRNVYHDLMGDFDGDPARLMTLSTTERAARLVNQVAGGPSKAINAARECLEDGSLGGAQMAFELAGALRITNPGMDVDAIYATAGRKLAYSQKSAYTRNYYLRLIAGL